MIISVANFIKDPEIKKVIHQSDDIRNKALSYCYNNIEHYAEMPLTEKNQHYDSVVKKLLKQC